ncbi:MAG: ATP-binding protein [Gemmatimonadota bacterium]|nr:ATP-binding protein [Gemmatimonadota bacterium]
MKSSAAGPVTVTSRLIAVSQLACVVLFGVLLLRPWQATAPALGAAFVAACVAFAAAALSIALPARGLERVVFGAFALLAMALGLGEIWLIASPTTTAVQGLRDATSLELAIAITALNGLLVLYGNYALAAERSAAEQLQQRVSDEQALKASLEQRVVERTMELDDAQRVLHRMWWLGQQITLELNPRRVLDRFLEAAADVARADGAALGLLATDGMIEIVAASGALSGLAGQHVPVSGSAMGRVIRGGGTWSVADAAEHRGQVHPTWFEHQRELLHGMAVVAVQRRGERIGAVTIASAGVRTFSLLELERVEAMADLLSVALANAELFETLRQAEWRFRTLFRAAPDAVLTVLQTTGRVREANDAVREVFGLDPHQVVGRSLIEMVVPGDRATLEAVLAKAFTGVPARAEVQVMAPDGGTRLVALAASRLPEADPPSALLVGRDMTHEREMRLRLMESDRLAAVGELVAGVAHEVNNPLSSISAFAQLLLRDGSLTHPQRESIEVIRAETMRASQVVKDLLAFARRSEPQQAPLDINGVVSRTLRMRQYQFSEAAVRAVPDLADHLPSVMGDARQLQQVCLNLLTNAVQAMSLRGGGTLQVRTYAAEGAVRLEVTDTGPGILPEARAHIFEPFFTTKKEGEGTGLGLSVSYGIVTAHGGTIEVVDTGAHGTTFRVSLPAASAPANAQETTREPPLTLRSPLAGIKLLFVDDEPALRSGMQAFGALRGFTVLTASDGLAALETARTTGVDAVVCDLRMPGMDGFAFHEQLRRERPGLAERTVFITGDVVTITGTRGSTARQPVLTKPFAFDRIEEALIAVMRGAPYVPTTSGRG